MQILTSIAEMRLAVSKLREELHLLGLVPTMGAIHDGHLSLVAAARQNCDYVAASIFVNPLQFGPSEDLSRYPRTFDRDVSLLADAGVDLLFAPSVEEMYPAPQTTFVEVEGVGDRLDGASRPGHFRGVATVVLKLFHIVTPDTAFFGQKDAAQVAVLRAMVRDLDVPVRLVVCPTLREADGLAMSSRNRFLTDAERIQALALSRSLAVAERLAAEGVRSASAICHAVLATLEEEPALRVDYAEVVDPDTLLPMDTLDRPALVAVAGWVGTTRLIDNCILEVAHG